jgi:competence protein ComGC
LIEIMVVMATIGILAALAVPNYIKAREYSQTGACIENLKKVDGAISTWGLENRKSAGDAIIHAELFGPDKYVREPPACPSGGSYTYFAVGDAPQVDCDKPSHDIP